MYLFVYQPAYGYADGTCAKNPYSFSDGTPDAISPTITLESVNSTEPAAAPLPTEITRSLLV
jgi:hypothetical protein